MYNSHFQVKSDDKRRDYLNIKNKFEKCEQLL